MDEKTKNDKSAKYDKFEDFMVELLMREHTYNSPEEEKELREDLSVFVEFNVEKLFEETMVAFRWTTKDELDKAKKDVSKETKKETAEA